MTVPARPDERHAQPPTGTPPERERTFTTEQLFGDKKEIQIDHDGERYRLRITRRNKLILQK